MDKKIFKGQNVEEAVEIAAEAFGVEAAELHYDVLKQPKEAFLGIFGGKDAEIEAWVDEKQPVASEELEAEDAVEEQETEPLSLFVSGGDCEYGVFGAEAEEAEDEEDEEIQPAEEADTSADSEYDYEEESEEPAAPIDEESIARVKSFLEGLLRNMEIDGTVTCSVKEDRIYAEIKGEHIGAVIGHRGETLDCIQYLTGLAVNRHGCFHHITVDAEGYRAKREATVRSLAKRYAMKCIKSHRAVVLEPMSAGERRLIHMELQNFRGVSTHSEGEEPYRKVVITCTGSRRREY